MSAVAVPLRNRCGVSKLTNGMPTWGFDGLTVENANEPRIAALVGDSGSTLVIYGRQKEHVTAFDERFVRSRNLCQHHARLNVVSKPPRVEAVLQ